MSQRLFALSSQPSPGHAGHSSVPRPLTPLLGREHELSKACALLRHPDVRLLTLTGTGGVGKTRLAIQVALDLLEDFPDGIVFVSLAPISDPERVLPTIAQALDLRHADNASPLEQLQGYLRNQRCLLFLDNYEQVISAAPSLADLLTFCPDLRLLVTSREALRVQGEYEFAVPPLAVPDLAHLPEREALAEVATMALFLQRAQAIQPGFQLTAANAATIAEICARLEGLPLAVELAAARIKLFPPQALLARLSRRLDVLTGGARDLPTRQQTLRNTLHWSYDLLSAVEQRLLRQLAIFVGGCTLEAVTAVAQALTTDTSGPQPNILERISSLLDKSLVLQTEQEGEELRFLLLETIREYGLEHLQTLGEREAARQAHAIAEGDKVVSRWMLRGTHQGASLGIPSTGKHITMPGISIVRMEGDKAAENWVIYDQMVMLQQPGLAPVPSQASS